MVRTLDNLAQSNPEWSGLNPDPATSKAPWRIYNIGNSQPVELLYYIECIEKSLGKTTEKELLPLQPGDVEHTFADVRALIRDIGYQPSTSLQDGVAKFIEWFVDYYVRENE